MGKKDAAKKYALIKDNFTSLEQGSGIMWKYYNFSVFLLTESATANIEELLGFCTFESCVGIFWPSIMKMRSQDIPEEARSTIMNFFRIPLNIFVCVVLYNVDAFPITLMFGLCSIFVMVSCILQRRLMVIAEKPRSSH